MNNLRPLSSPGIHLAKDFTKVLGSAHTALASLTVSAAPEGAEAFVGSYTPPARAETEECVIVNGRAIPKVITINSGTLLVDKVFTWVSGARWECPSGEYFLYSEGELYLFSTSGSKYLVCTTSGFQLIYEGTWTDPNEGGGEDWTDAGGVIPPTFSARESQDFTLGDVTAKVFEMGEGVEPLIEFFNADDEFEGSLDLETDTWTAGTNGYTAFTLGSYAPPILTGAPIVGETQLAKILVPSGRMARKLAVFFTAYAGDNPQTVDAKGRVEFRLREKVLASFPVVFGVLTEGLQLWTWSGGNVGGDPNWLSFQTNGGDNIQSRWLDLNFDADEIRLVLESLTFNECEAFLAGLACLSEP
jgi:hypothetical protein